MIFAPLLVCLLQLTQSSSALPTRVRQVYDYPLGTWIENIAVRKNGSLVLTSINYPGGLQQLNPFDGSSPTTLIDRLPGNATLGIVEAEHDVFYFINANFNLGVPVGTEPGTNVLWSYDFNTRGYKKTMAIPQASLLNGLAKFNNTLLLTSDSRLGVVYGIDLIKNSSFVLAQDPLMAPLLNESFQEGINGLKFLKTRTGGKLFFTNSQRYTYSLLELDAHARPVGKAKLIAKSFEEKGVPLSLDDFALDAHGTAYIATGIGNSVDRVTQKGRIRRIAGRINSTAILEPTSVAFGRRDGDDHTLYVATAGGLGFPAYVNGMPRTRGAQIVAIKI